MLLLPTACPLAAQGEGPVRGPRVDLSATPTVISGLGLGTATIAVKTRPRSQGGLRQVTLSADRGSLDPHEVELDQAGSGQSTLRSSGIGACRIEVVGEGIRFAPLFVDFVWPLAFLAAALIGGFAGALVARRCHRSRARQITNGVLVGLIAAVAYALGVNLIGIDVSSPFSEAAIFVIAAIAALIGLPRLPLRLRGEEVEQAPA
ncbi:MAG: hypothetical protein ACE5F1_14775 [Planctomycetota bacterium]